MKIFYVFDICSGKKLVNNYMFKINIKNTRTLSELLRHQNFSSIVDFEHVFVCYAVTFIFIVWMIFIILIHFIFSMICRKIGIGVDFEISLGVSHVSIFVSTAS